MALQRVEVVGPEAAVPVYPLVDLHQSVGSKRVDAALGVGAQVRDVKARGEEPSGMLAFQHRLATKLVLSKVQERFGGRVRFMISGSAPLNADVAKWFGAVGLLVQEGYGLTETSSGSTAPATACGSTHAFQPPGPGSG